MNGPVEVTLDESEELRRFRKCLIYSVLVSAVFLGICFGISLMEIPGASNTVAGAVCVVLICLMFGFVTYRQNRCRIDKDDYDGLDAKL